MSAGRPADPFGSPESGEKPPPGAPYREIPIGVPESPAEFEERKRAAELPDRRGSGDDDAQIDYGDGGSQP